jgi:hypothetical protein
MTMLIQFLTVCGTKLPMNTSVIVNIDAVQAQGDEPHEAEQPLSNLGVFSFQFHH